MVNRKRKKIPTTEMLETIMENQAIIMRSQALLQRNLNYQNGGESMAHILKKRAYDQDIYMGKTNIDEWGYRL